MDEQTAGRPDKGKAKAIEPPAPILINAPIQTGDDTQADPSPTAPTLLTASAATSPTDPSPTTPSPTTPQNRVHFGATPTQQPKRGESSDGSVSKVSKESELHPTIRDSTKATHQQKDDTIDDEEYHSLKRVESHQYASSGIVPLEMFGEDECETDLTVHDEVLSDIAEEPSKEDASNALDMSASKNKQTIKEPLSNATATTSTPKFPKERYPGSKVAVQATRSQSAVSRTQPFEPSHDPYEESSSAAEARRQSIVDTANRSQRLELEGDQGTGRDVQINSRPGMKGKAEHCEVQETKVLAEGSSNACANECAGSTTKSPVRESVPTYAEANFNPQPAGQLHEPLFPPVEPSGFVSRRKRFSM